MVIFKKNIFEVVFECLRVFWAHKIDMFVIVNKVTFLGCLHKNILQYKQLQGGGGAEGLQQNNLDFLTSSMLRVNSFKYPGEGVGLVRVKLNFLVGNNWSKFSLKVFFYKNLNFFFCNKERVA